MITASREFINIIVVFSCSLDNLLKFTNQCHFPLCLTEMAILFSTETARKAYKEFAAISLFVLKIKYDVYVNYALTMLSRQSSEVRIVNFELLYGCCMNIERKNDCMVVLATKIHHAFTTKLNNCDLQSGNYFKHVILVLIMLLLLLITCCCL